MTAAICSTVRDLMAAEARAATSAGLGMVEVFTSFVPPQSKNTSTTLATYISPCSPGRDPDDV
jgi:hypothetical protein